MKTSVGSVTITVLGTLAIAAVAYGAASGFHVQRTGDIHPMPREARPTPSSTPLPVELPSPHPTSGGLLAIDADMADASTGWMVLTDCPTQGSCHYFVAGTTDAGQSWSSPVQVGPSYPSGPGFSPRTIRFVNRLDGFVYSNQDAFAYVTHDGGKTWRALDVPYVFLYGITISSGTAWVTTYPCPKGTQCQLEVRSSADGGRTWSAAHKLPPGYSPEAPVAFPTGVIMSSVPTGDIEITSNRGLTWRSLKSACAANSFRGFVTTVDATELWEQCLGNPDSSGVFGDVSLFVSEDGGKTWTRRSWPPVMASPGGESLVTSRALVAFAFGGNRSFVTRDGGKTWTDMSDQGTTFTAIRFGTGWGWALDPQRVIWQTFDGGDHWSEVGSLPDRLS
jgi:photosystem II stability/assembly factor-like uncharacterized protein